MKDLNFSKYIVEIDRKRELIKISLIVLYLSKKNIIIYQ